MAGKKPKISVVIPTYNQASLLKQALDSVRAQTFEDWEAIVINNFSNDPTESIVTSYQDPRISLINFANHGVIAASRNLGIQKAQGEFIAFLDSDDIWFPEKLQICLQTLNENFADAVCHNEFQVRDGRQERILSYGPENKFSYLNMLFYGNCVSTSALLIRRSRLLEAGCFNENKTINTAEDYDLWMRLARNHCKFVFLQKELGNYLVHGSNNSGSVERHFSAILSVTQLHFTALRKNQNGFLSNLWLSLRMRIRIATLFYGAARQAQSQGLKKESLAYFLKSLSLNPLRPKTFLGLILLTLSPRNSQQHG
jgi:glycosyltransferase involved in cell wall biosynthesis